MDKCICMMADAFNIVTCICLEVELRCEFRVRNMQNDVTLWGRLDQQHGCINTDTETFET